jgi:metal-responsive CopG/Arc/MetJ family transcriptional regulator
MKTAISIPTPMFREADRVAKRLKVSRSELYRRALEAFIAALDTSEVTASYDAAYASAESPSEREFRRTSTRRLLRNVEWEA